LYREKFARARLVGIRRDLENQVRSIAFVIPHRQGWIRMSRIDASDREVDPTGARG
jgi:hypothetical protein